MKIPILACVTAALTFLAAAPNAEARSYRNRAYRSHVYISGYRTCGTPIYTERYLIGYTRCGDPIWGYRTVSAPRCYVAPPKPRCYVAPPRPCYDNYPRSGVVIQGTFRL